jgi:hypothetical protein
MFVWTGNPFFKRLPEKHFEPSTDLQQAMRTFLFQFYKEKQAVGNQSKKDLVAYHIVTRSVKLLYLDMLFDPLKKQFNLPSPTIDVTEFFCFQIESIGNDSNPISF